MRIRRAIATDRAEILALADRLAAFGPTTRSAEEVAARERRALADTLDAPAAGSELYVADDEELGMVSVLLLETRADYFTAESHGHVSILSVAQRAEGRGVGSALLREAELWARERGFRRLTLAVFDDNRRAKDLYSRHGWRPELNTYFKLLSAERD